jgi:acyl carrier protein
VTTRSPLARPASRAASIEYEVETMITGDAARTEFRSQAQGESEPGAAENLEWLVEEFLTEELGFAPGVVVPTARFAADYGVGSLDLLELAVGAQERFGAEISDEALVQVVTVGDFGQCVIEAVERRERHHPPT